MTKLIKNHTTNNRDLLNKYFKPISSLPQDIAEWKTFTKLSDTATFFWYPKAGLNFDNINLNSNASDKLYIFTDTLQSDDIYDLIFNVDRKFFSGATDNGTLNMIKSNICEMMIFCCSPRA